MCPGSSSQWQSGRGKVRLEPKGRKLVTEAPPVSTSARFRETEREGAEDVRAVSDASVSGQRSSSGRQHGGDGVIAGSARTLHRERWSFLLVAGGRHKAPELSSGQGGDTPSARLSVLPDGEMEGPGGAPQAGLGAPPTGWGLRRPRAAGGEARQPCSVPSRCRTCWHSGVHPGGSGASAGWSCR